MLHPRLFFTFLLGWRQDKGFSESIRNREAVLRSQPLSQIVKVPLAMIVGRQDFIASRDFLRACH